MCYQVFVHYACGHGDIHNAVCEKGEGNPIWFKPGCPDYHSESKYPIRFCGIGKFYCGRNGLDGAFLDGAHVLLERRKAELPRIEANLLAIKQKAKEFTISANEHNVPQEARLLHPVHGKICQIHYYFKDRREEAMRDVNEANQIIGEGVLFFGPLPDDSGQTYPAIQPAFVPTTNSRIPLELKPPEANEVLPPGIPIAAPTMAVTEQAIDVSQNPLMRQVLPRLPPSEGENINVTHVRRDSGNLGPDSNKATPTPTPQKTMPPGLSLAQSGSGFRDIAAKRLIQHNANPANSRRRKHVATKRLPRIATEDSNSIRRSTRVRKQKVNYAESQGSELSRNTSPDKADQYDESPEKEKSISDWSEASESPEPPARGRPQRKTQRRAANGGDRSNNDNLASKIGDWKRRSGEVQKGNNGKSAPAHAAQAPNGRAGGQAAGQRNDGGQQTSGCKRASSKVWRAPPSAHAQFLMNGGKPCGAGGPGTFGFGSEMDSTQSTNPMQPTLGRPFPDNSDATAVVGNNIFNSFLQKSYNMPRQSTQSWSVQPGTSYPMQQQMLSGNSSQATTPSSYTYQPQDMQNYGGSGDFNGSLPMDPNAGHSSIQSGSLPGLNAYTGGFNQDLSSGTQTPATQASYGTNSYFKNQAGFQTGNNPYYGGYNQGGRSGLQTSADSSAASVGQTGEYNQISDYSQAPEADYSQLPTSATYFDYDAMRLSFRASKDLSPAKTSQATMSVTEPKKRALPASSPTPAAKRGRLSLPGEGNMSNVYGNGIPYGGNDESGAATSSPAKMLMQQDQMTTYSAPFENTVHIVSPRPAPIISPAAIHFPQAQAGTVVETLEDAADLPSMGAAGVGEQHDRVETGENYGDTNEGTGGTEEVNEDAEFDWSMLDDDVFAFGDA